MSFANSMVTGARIPRPCLNWGSATIHLRARLSHWPPAAGFTIPGIEPGQDFTNTYVVGRFQQRLFHRLYLGLAVGYENADYFAAADNVNAPRNDDYWFIEPSLDVLITRWLSAGVYYLHREDSSNTDFFSFDDNQVGVRATVRF